MTGHVVVTGCAGFIGSHLTDRLLQLGGAVTGIDSFDEYYPRSHKVANLATAAGNSRFTLIDGDLLDLAEMNASDRGLPSLVRGATCVYHIAAQAGVRPSWGRSFDIYARNNILATQRVLEACSDAGVARVVFASSSSVYGDTDQLPSREDADCRPISPYGVTKLAGEHLCRLYSPAHGLSVVALRFFTVYGPRQRPDMAFHKFIRAAILGGPADMFGDGSQSRDFTFISDIVEGLIAAGRLGVSGTYNLGGGSRVSLRAALDVIEHAVGHAVPLRECGTQAGDVRDTAADLSRARRDLGYSPRIDLAEGIAQQVAWMQASLEAVPLMPTRDV